MRQIVGILGTPIDILDTEGVLRRMEEFICEGSFHQVATANLDFLVNAMEDIELQRILCKADLVMPDGKPVVWMASGLRGKLPERVTGADIVPALAELAARKGYRIYMLGAEDSVAESAKANLEAQYPGIQIVGRYSPPLSPLIEMDNEPILADIAKTKPHILLVAFGNPKQEKWIHLNAARLQKVPVCIGIGGTFDFISKRIPRAPQWMGKVGIEWIHRMAANPKKFGPRYYKDFIRGGYGFSRQFWSLHSSRWKGKGELQVRQERGVTVLSVVGDLKAPLLPKLAIQIEQALASQNSLLLDFLQAKTVDGAALGMLLNLPEHVAQKGGEVQMVVAPSALKSLLEHSYVLRLYPHYETVEKALLAKPAKGLCWEVQGNGWENVVTVQGQPEPHTLHSLECLCTQLLQSGRRLDLDARGITYTNSALLTLIYRLTHTYNSVKTSFYLVPGEAMHAALVREKLISKLALRETPHLPPDAV